MDTTPKPDHIRLLTHSIETSVERGIKTPRDFTFLRECIFARLKVYLSESTLKRVWEYLPRGNTRIYTLDVLSSFLGYSSWDQFVESICQTGGDAPSSFALGHHLCSREDLVPGQRLLVVWQPGRQCEILYLGDGAFEVLSSAGTRLSPGDTFSCAFFIDGEPLYLSDLVQKGKPPVAYICGKISGIRFQKL